MISINLIFTDFNMCEREVYHNNFPDSLKVNIFHIHIRTIPTNSKSRKEKTEADKISLMIEMREK
jgi:hypothetical protein